MTCGWWLTTASASCRARTPCAHRCAGGWEGVQHARHGPSGQEATKGTPTGWRRTPHPALTRVSQTRPALTSAMGEQVPSETCQWAAKRARHGTSRRPRELTSSSLLAHTLDAAWKSARTRRSPAQPATSQRRRRERAWPAPPNSSPSGLVKAASPLGGGKEGADAAREDGGSNRGTLTAVHSCSSSLWASALAALALPRSRSFSTPPVPS